MMSEESLQGQPALSVSAAAAAAREASGQVRDCSRQAGLPPPPRHWNKLGGQDWASSRTSHATE